MNALLTARGEILSRPAVVAKSVVCMQIEVGIDLA